MDNKDLLTILKMDLQIVHDHSDSYLETLLEASRSAIQREGISLEDTADDSLLLSMYAAYLYRRRAETENAMPRMLRYALNNRLLSQKMKGGGRRRKGGTLRCCMTRGLQNSTP